MWCLNNNFKLFPGVCGFMEQIRVQVRTNAGGQTEKLCLRSLSSCLIYIFIIVFPLFEHSCGDGMVVSSEGKGCVDRNECLDMPCLNGGTCINQEPRLRYRCVCPENFWGENCMFMKERQALKLSTSALFITIACLLIIISKPDLPPKFIWDQ